ncbi:helix-turn-helix domain-containing protein [Paraburkholderia sediminicola]|uniref:helix-turn-helix domain-containing protein n=1 Tax=Paraburkholderia sediminicola TaxID=458836 RepID=UPI0038BDDC9C
MQRRETKRSRLKGVRMKVRKMKRARGRVTLGSAYLSSDEAALVLHVSRECFYGLVRTGELVATRRTRDGHRWFSMANLLAYKERSKVRQRAGLDRMMESTRRIGLYDAELEGLPPR